jgi:hypothetical protein
MVVPIAPRSISVADCRSTNAVQRGVFLELRKTFRIAQNRCSVIKPIGAALFNQLIIKAEDQDGRRPLSDKKSFMMSIEHFEDQGTCNRGSGCPQKGVGREFRGLFFNGPCDGPFGMLCGTYHSKLYERAPPVGFILNPAKRPPAAIVC